VGRLLDLTTKPLRGAFVFGRRGGPRLAIDGFLADVAGFTYVVELDRDAL
jgi:hypothetical protein